jgi:hypothetical protein
MQIYFIYTVHQGTLQCVCVFMCIFHAFTMPLELVDKAALVLKQMSVDNPPKRD